MGSPVPDNIDQWLTIREGFPRPDRKAIRAWIDAHVADADKNAAWLAITRMWLWLIHSPASDWQWFAYHLAEALVRRLARDPEAFREFVAHADGQDAGEAAAREYLGLSLAEPLEELFGPGDGAPAPSLWTNDKRDAAKDSLGSPAAANSSMPVPPQVASSIFRVHLPWPLLILTSLGRVRRVFSVAARPLFAVSW